MLLVMKRKSSAIQPERHTYLLRFWLESEQRTWRVYLKEASTGQEHLFANFPELVAFLTNRLAKFQDDISSEIEEEDGA